MVYQIPDAEPAEIRAGDTIIWRKTLADFPASAGWVLTYRLINASHTYDITAAADGDTHLVQVAASASADYAAGDYTWVSQVTLGAERHTIAQGGIKVLPNLAAAEAGIDTRSTAKKTLELLDAAMLAHGAKAWTQEYEIAGRQMKFRSVSEFMSFRSKVMREVQGEENAERIKQGLPLKNKLNVRF